MMQTTRWSRNFWHRHFERIEPDSTVWHCLAPDCDFYCDRGQNNYTGDCAVHLRENHPEAYAERRELAATSAANNKKKVVTRSKTVVPGKVQHESPFPKRGEKKEELEGEKVAPRPHTPPPKFAVAPMLDGGLAKKKRKMESSKEKIREEKMQATMFGAPSSSKSKASVETPSNEDDPLLHVQVSRSFLKEEVGIDPEKIEDGDDITPMLVRWQNETMKNLQGLKVDAHPNNLEHQTHLPCTSKSGGEIEEINSKQQTNMSTVGVDDNGGEMVVGGYENDANGISQKSDHDEGEGEETEEDEGQQEEEEGHEKGEPDVFDVDSSEGEDEDVALVGDPTATDSKVLLSYPVIAVGDQNEANAPCQLTRADLRLLAPRKKLNDSLIDFYLRYIRGELVPADRRGKVFLFNTFFYGRLVHTLNPKEDIQKRVRNNYDSVRKWTRGVDLFSMDQILIPINDKAQCHWYLAIIVNPGNGVLPVVQEPLAKTPVAIRKGGDRHRPAPTPYLVILNSAIPDTADDDYARIREALGEYLSLECSHRDSTTNVKTPSKMFDRDRLMLLAPEDTPQQKNLVDCGLYLLHFAECFLTRPPKTLKPADRSAKFAKWFPNFNYPKKRDEVRAKLMALAPDLLQPSDFVSVGWRHPQKTAVKKRHR